jgi:hypothetical protein
MTAADFSSQQAGGVADELHVKLHAVKARWSKTLNSLQPLLLKYPHLRHVPHTSPIPSRPVDERLQCPVIDAIMSSVTPEDDEERRQMAELGVLLRDGHDVVVAMLYGYLMHPGLAFPVHDSSRPDDRRSKSAATAAECSPTNADAAASQPTDSCGPAANDVQPPTLLEVR